MSEENFIIIRSIGLAVRDGLGPYVLNAYKFKFTKKQYLEVLQETLRIEHPFDSHDDALELLDLQAWLNAMEFNWNDVFSRKLGHTARDARRDNNVSRARSYVNELRGTRNLFSHEAPKDEFTDEDVYRIADTATRLLRAVKAREQAAKTEEIRVEFGFKIYMEEVEASECEPELEQAAAAEPGNQASEEQLTEDENEISNDRVDLNGLDLSGMDLRGRNLQLANLKGADLSVSNLDGADFGNMELSNVNLSKANLHYAKLGGSNLSHANLFEARLEFANLSEANLSHAMMEKADLRSANINGTVFSNANLTKADFSNSAEEYGHFINGIENYEEYCAKGALCYSMEFTNAILRQANMQRVFFEDVNLTQADLSEADFNGGRIQGGSFAGAILNSANLTNCEILSCDFSGAKMNGVDLSGVRYCVHSNFTNTEMVGANLEKFFIDPHNIDEVHHWENVDLSGANLTDAVLPRQSFRNANLTGAVFKDAYLSRADLSHADLMDTDFTGAELECVNFIGAKFRYTTILPDGSYWNEDTDMTQFTGPLEDC